MARTPRADSAFVAIHDGTRVLCLSRQDKKRSLYLPGGGIPSPCVGTQANDLVRSLIASQLGVRHISSSQLHIWTNTHFKMSKQAGGGYVTLFPYKVDTAELDGWVAQWKENEKTGAAVLLTVDDIWDHLHQTERMPWGQANMAVRALLDESHGLLSQRGLLLRDDIGLIKGHGVWARPE